MNSPIEVLDHYADAFRDLVNTRVWANDESPEKLLRLGSPGDWEFICVAMDVIGDASTAINHFLRFSLDGPTRYDNVGERYLRLYGLLSATYLQQEAALKLFVLMHCPKPKEVLAQFLDLDIRTLRNQVASHSVDYPPRGGGKPQAIVPVCVDLKGFSCVVTEGRGNGSRAVQLDKAVNEHCHAVISVLDRIYEKSINTIFKGHSKRIQEFRKKLDDLRFMRDGNLLIRFGTTSEPSEIRVVFVSPTGATGPHRSRSK